MKRTVAFSLLGVILTASAFAADETLTERMLRRLHGKPADCPEDMDGTCAAIDHDFKSLKKTLSMYAESSRGRRIVVSFVGEWERDGEWRTRCWLEGDEIVRIVFDPKRRIVAVQDRFFCLTDPPERVAGDSGLTDPRRVAGLMPAYPSFRKTGSAVLQLHVAADGQVADACVLYERPRGNGFGRAALAAVRSWRFEPGFVDDEAVDTVIALDFTWRHGGCSYRRSVRSLR